MFTLRAASQKAVAVRGAKANQVVRVGQVVRPQAAARQAQQVADLTVRHRRAIAVTMISATTRTRVTVMIRPTIAAAADFT